VGIVPWLGLLLQGLWSGVREQSRGFQAQKMLLIWTVFIFFFFSISGSKLPSYTLPIFPAIALLIACYLEKVSSKMLMFNALLLALIGLAGLIFSGKIGGLSQDPYEIPLYQAAVPWTIAAAAIALAGGVIATLLAKRHKDMAVISLSLAAFVAGQALFLGHDTWGRYSAGLLHVPAIEAELSADTPIYSVGVYEQSLPFYLQRTLILVGEPDELEFGLKQQPELWIPKVDDFIEKWRVDSVNGKPAIAILRPNRYREMLEKKLPMRIIAEDPKRVIISNQLIPVTDKSRSGALPQ
jgi:4-amino-4-deoxy-L-arabinose transferase-like glycosyltransferase